MADELAKLVSDLADAIQNDPKRIAEIGRALDALTREDEPEPIVAVDEDVTEVVEDHEGRLEELESLVRRPRPEPPKLLPPSPTGGAYDHQLLDAARHDDTVDIDPVKDGMIVGDTTPFHTEITPSVAISAGDVGFAIWDGDRTAGDRVYIVETSTWPSDGYVAIETDVQNGCDGKPNAVLWQFPLSGITNDLLDGQQHQDTADQTCSTGSLIVGNTEATPLWDELVIGTAGKVLTSDGTSPSWETPTAATNPTGTVIFSVASSAPTGYLACNHVTDYSQTTYAALYAMCGSDYNGGDSPSAGQFYVPNIANRVVAGVGSGSFATAGTELGVETQYYDHAHEVLTGTPNVLGTDTAAYQNATGPPLWVDAGTEGTDGPDGGLAGAGDHDMTNVQPTIVLYAYIKT